MPITARRPQDEEAAVQDKRNRTAKDISQGEKPNTKINCPSDQNQEVAHALSPPNSANDLEITKSQDRIQEKPASIQTKIVSIPSNMNPALSPRITGESCTEGGSRPTISTSGSNSPEIKVKSENTGQGDAIPHPFKTHKKSYPHGPGSEEGGNTECTSDQEHRSRGRQRTPD